MSPDGLIVTNHHCVTGGLQFNSTPKRNLLKDGYLAKTRDEELPNGPGSRVFVTTSVTDVTTSITGNIDPKATDRERYDLIDRPREGTHRRLREGRTALQRRVVLRRTEVLRNRPDGDQGRAPGLRARRGNRRIRRRDRQLALAPAHRRLEFSARLCRQGRQAGRLLQGQRSVQAEALAEGLDAKASSRATWSSWPATRDARSGIRPTRR